MSSWRFAVGGWRLSLFARLQRAWRIATRDNASRSRPATCQPPTADRRPPTADRRP